MSNFLKEYRCRYCNKLFFKGNLVYCTIEIKCKNCKKLNTFEEIKGINCRPFLLFDQHSSYKRSDGTLSSSKGNTVKQRLNQCLNCQENNNCEYYKLIKSTLT
ncbi:hypothetical protein AMJ47_01585 [Parcubacteria bacterium DG_72]|nr:MAG: hypothetical protein AMJ47_01585 [Parcubacteria bacterium DG_72]